jgi:putative multiple sugar transport system permease protein
MLADLKDLLKKNPMFLALIAIVILFQILIITSGRGSLFRPANISNLINQNAYVMILATGMLLCIISGGNIDLSVGSVVAFVGAIAATLIISLQVNIMQPLCCACCVAWPLAFGRVFG